MALPFDQDYVLRMRYLTAKFLHYRTNPLNFDAGEDPTWVFWEVPLRYIERGEYPSAFPPYAMPWLIQYFDRGSTYLDADLDSFPSAEALKAAGFDDRTQRAWNALQALKGEFTAASFCMYRRVLGFGGLGLAALFRYQNPSTPDRNLDFVAKIGLRGWENKDLREEEEQMRKHSRAAHIVQVIEPEEINKPPKNAWPREPVYDDSSDEYPSSGDESIEGPTRPPRKRRRDLTQAELATKMARWLIPPSPQPPASQGPASRKDYILLEYVENGDLYEFLARATERQTNLPNRVLWAFWLCLVRSCVAMAFPPRKFHPDRETQPRGDLTEVIPDQKHQWRMKRMVHFDIDPQNIFIGGFDRSEGEHALLPRLKLGDFGHAEEIKTQKRDRYYVNRRDRAKRGYCAPEQFSDQWDFVPADANAARLCNEPIAANYGPHTNVWGIGLIMFSLITKLYPPSPPQPGVSDEGLLTYGRYLLSSDFEHADESLRRIVVRCLAHDPSQRPDLKSLLQEAEAGVLQDFPREPDEFIRGWIQEMLNNAPAGGPAGTGS